MDSVIFRPVNVTGKLIKRQLGSKIIDGVAPLNVLLTPSGYGKTALALDVYEAWPESRLWVNAEHHEDFVSGARILLAYLSHKVDGGFSFKADLDDVAKLAIQVGDRLHLILKPFLLVVDGLTPHHDSRIIELFYELSQYLPSQHKILVNGLSGVARPSQRLLCQGNIQLFTAPALRFNSAETASVVPPTWRQDTHRMQLVNACEGWPVLLGLMVQQEIQENDFCLQEQVLIRYISEVMSHSLSAAALQFANLLVEVPEFDSELLTCFRGHDAEIVKELVDTGFLIQLQHYGFQYYFRWPPLVRKALQQGSARQKISRLELLRLLAWADRTGRWADGLNFALQLDNPAQIITRLIRTGRQVQELGKANLLREALALVRQHTPIEENMDLLFIDLAAHTLQPEKILQAKIAQSYRLLETLSVDKQRQYRVWIECVEAQAIMRKSDLVRAQAFADRIRDNVCELPDYYQTQALGVLGEVAMLSGDLAEALHYFQQGEMVAMQSDLLSSVLWHRHQRAQVMTQMGQINLATNVRFAAIQFAREKNGMALFSYECLLRAHCEQLLRELRTYEAEPFLIELEQRCLLIGDVDGLPVNMLRLELHRLRCWVDSQYHYDISATVEMIERALLGAQHPHVQVRAEQTLLNHWHQTEQIHAISQWYSRHNQPVIHPQGADELLHLRNLIFAYLVLQQHDIEVLPKWVDFTDPQLEKWLAIWPSVGPMAVLLYCLIDFHEPTDQRLPWIFKCIGLFSQANNLAEPLAYHPSWLEPLFKSNFTIQRFQSTFISRIHAIWGNRVKTRVVRQDRAQPEQTQNLGLSPREWQLLQCVAKGMTNEDIADHLNLCLGTVKNQLTKIYRKLGVSGRGAARSRYKSLAEVA